MIVPHVTTKYGDQKEQTVEGVPMCTLRNFPSNINHCIEWSREKFNSVFFEGPNDLKNYLENPQNFMK